MPKPPVLLTCALLAACSAAPVAPAPIASTEGPPAVAQASATPPSPEPLRSLPRQKIDALESLFASADKASPDRPALMRRLAEAYVELETTTLRDRETKAGDAAAAAAATQLAEAARRRAIGYYRMLVSEYPAWCSGQGSAGGCSDEVLFYLAFEHEQGKETDDARRVYRDLLTRFPKSRFVPEAHLALAEGLFAEAGSDAAKLTAAEQAYLEALRYPPPENRVAAYAHYKLAYVYWNKGDAAAAVDALGQAIAVAGKEPTVPGQVRLARAARKDLPQIYASFGDPTKAREVFARWSGDAPGESTQLTAMLGDLAKDYVDAGKHAAGVVVYLDVLRGGGGPKKCEVVARLDAALAAGGVPADVRAKAAADAKLKLARGECAAGR